MLDDAGSFFVEVGSKLGRAINRPLGQETHRGIWNDILPRGGADAGVVVDAVAPGSNNVDGGAQIVLVCFQIPC